MTSELDPLLKNIPKYDNYENDNDELKSQKAKSFWSKEDAVCRTIVLFAILAFTTSFGTGMMFFSVNTAMISFKLFVNESLLVC